jgi:hypothetical protein
MSTANFMTVSWFFIKTGSVIFKGKVYLFKCDQAILNC